MVYFIAGSGITVKNFMIHNGVEWEETSFNYGFDLPVRVRVRVRVRFRV